MFQFGFNSSAAWLFALVIVFNRWFFGSVLIVSFGDDSFRFIQYLTAHHSVFRCGLHKRSFTF
ncbi:hypothetical protein CXB77_04670 [Chromatium okenii]|uniref:Uncharacterized protein n=1 Tax=Chromatium okenii TaxID=61644 RepID=A0A2S7XU75_9GAMM|nr:hypothetical protein CXB77_04670 [Chromatium okenii]